MQSLSTGTVTNGIVIDALNLETPQQYKHNYNLKQWSLSLDIILKKRFVMHYDILIININLKCQKRNVSESTTNCIKAVDLDLISRLIA